MKLLKNAFIYLLVIMLLTSCKSGTQTVEDSAAGEQAGATEQTLATPYGDLRKMWNNPNATYEVGSYNAEDILSFTFNEGTVFKGNENLQKQIMANGRNPGLGIRGLHKQGITGKGVNVAIIDQNLLLNHPEFKGKIKGYYDTGCGTEPNKGSMHAPAVTSILVGESIGVAPGASVYFAAAPSWTCDSKYYADALKWIIEQNKQLPQAEKIRVVSVSAAPSGEGSPFSKNLEMWDKAVEAAEKDGILVIDCREGQETGFILPGFVDIENPEDVTKCSGGFPRYPETTASSKLIAVPCSFRTVAEEYEEGKPSYQYTGQGGLSWGIPYAAGVLALGWQLNPDLTNEQIVKLLTDTAYVNEKGGRFIYPTAFIEAVRKTK